MIPNKTNNLSISQVGFQVPKLKYFYISDSDGDAVNDIRIGYATTGIIVEICTVLNVAKGDGTWVNISGGYGGFFAYDKAIPFNIVVANVYHAFHLVTAADLTQGLLEKFTFYAGRSVDANIASEANTGGKLRVVCSGVHGLTANDLVVLVNMNNAAHNKPTRITVDGTNPTTEFICADINYVAGAGASAGLVDMPAYLKAGSGAAGNYFAMFTIDGTASNAGKDFKWELNTEITANDNVVSQRTTTNTLNSLSSSGLITLVEGDRVWISGKNLTDATDYTIKHMNLNLHKLTL